MSISNLGEHFGDSHLRHRQVPNIKLTQMTDLGSQPIQEAKEPLDVLILEVSGLNSIGQDIYHYNSEGEGKKRRRAGQRWRRECWRKGRILLMKWEQTKWAKLTTIKRKAEHLRGVQQQLEKTTWARWERMHPGPSLAEGSQNTKVAVVPVSNPEVPIGGTPLKQRQVDLSKLDEQTNLPELQNTEAMVLALQEPTLDKMSPGNKQSEIVVSTDNSIFTRTLEPFKIEHVAEILRLIKIGNNISTEEHILVESLVKDFADMFALSVHEVKHIPGATHCLEVSDVTQLHTQKSDRNQ